MRLPISARGGPAGSMTASSSRPAARASRSAPPPRPSIAAAASSSSSSPLGQQRLNRRRGSPQQQRAPRPSTGRVAAAADTDNWSTFEQLQFERGYCSLGPPAAEKYSPEAVRAQVLGPDGIGAWRLAGRALEIAVRLGAFAAAALWDRALGRDGGGGGILGYGGSSQAFPSTGDAAADAEAAALFARENPQAAAAAAAVVRARAAQLRRALVDLGPSFIKAGQVLASRPDIVREDYMNELCTLQDDVPPFPDDEAFAIIESELGKPLGAAFRSISKSPVAAASLGQVYRAVLRDNGADVAVKVQRPGVKPLVLADLVIFRAIAGLVTPLALRRLGCNAELIVDEFGEKLLEELDYTLEARNARDFRRNFEGDPTVKIPWVRDDLSGKRVLTMEWIDGMRCTDPAAIVASGIDVDAFIRGGVVSGLRQLLEFGLFHGDPHPGNIFALRDGRIAYVDFGNVAELSARNKQTLVDAVVHAVNEDYDRMARDFVNLGFLSPGTDIAPLVPALESIWADSVGRSLQDFNFRSVTSKFNELVYEHPIRIPERYALVIRSLLTQEGICLRLRPSFHFLEVAYPYVARRLLTDDDPALRERLLQVLLADGRFQWERLENLLRLAKNGNSGNGGAAGAAAEGAGAAAGALPSSSSASASSSSSSSASASSSASSSTSSGGGLDLSDTVASALRLVASDGALRGQLLDALTEGDRLHVEEVTRLLRLVAEDVDGAKVAREAVGSLPALGRQLALAWADGVLSR